MLKIWEFILTKIDSNQPASKELQDTVQMKNFQAEGSKNKKVILAKKKKKRPIHLQTYFPLGV